MGEPRFHLWTIALQDLGVIIAAVCLWLGVRIFNRRERWAKWTLAAIVCPPALYLLGFGPACWWFYEIRPTPDKTLSCLTIRRPPKFYRPLGQVLIKMPGFVADGVACYALLGANGEPIWCGDAGPSRPIYITW